MGCCPLIKSSIRNKLILFLLFATIVPFATSIAITYYFTKEKVTQGTIANNSNLLSQGRTNLTNYLNGVVQASLTIYTDEKFYKAVGANDIDYEGYNELRRGLSFMAHSVKEIHQVYLYAKASNHSFLITNEFMNRSVEDQPFTSPYYKLNQEVSIEPTHVSGNYGKELSPYFLPSTVISMHRKVIDFPENKILGELSIDLNLDLIRSITDELYSEKGEELYILDQTGKIVIGPNPASWGHPMNEGWAQQAIGSKEQRSSFEWTKEHFSGINIYERMKTDYVDWTIVKRIPYEQLYKGARQLTLINSFVLTFFLVIAIIATVFISIRFTSPIKELLRYMTKIQSGNMTAEIEVTRSDELGILATRFKVLMQNINNLIMREYRLELANKDNQLKALQAQINPHFLNNALQSIGTLALQHDAPRIYSLISSLAKMMRYSMNTHVAYVPFSKELDHVKSYLDLQKQRFEHQLEVSYQIEDATKAIEMPKMILQPIVENYFKHGFEPSLGTGKLLIASEIVEENAERRFHIRVENNGSGMTEDRLKEVTALLGNASDEKYIGLSNVLSRLRLYYNDSVSLDINLLAQGVQIHLTIPIEKEELR